MSVLLLLGDNLVTSQAEQSRLSRTDSRAVRHSLWGGREGGGYWEGRKEWKMPQQEEGVGICAKTKLKWGSFKWEYGGTAGGGWDGGCHK